MIQRFTRSGMLKDRELSALSAERAARGQPGELFRRGPEHFARHQRLRTRREEEGSSVLPELHLLGTASDFPGAGDNRAREKKSAQRTFSCRKEPREQAIHLFRAPECAQEPERRPCAAAFEPGGRCVSGGRHTVPKGFRPPQKLCSPTRSNDPGNRVHPLR